MARISDAKVDKQVKQVKQVKKGVRPLSDKQTDSLRFINDSLSCCKCGCIPKTCYRLKCDHCICQNCYKKTKKSSISCSICGKKTNYKDIQHDCKYDNLAENCKKIENSVFSGEDKSDEEGKFEANNPPQDGKQSSPLVFVSDTTDTGIPKNKQYITSPTKTSIKRDKCRGPASPMKKCTKTAKPFDIKEYTLIATCLTKEEEKEKVKEFADHYNINFIELNEESISCNQFSKNDKCIVIIDQQDRWCERSTEYLYSLACGAWILYIDWINECLDKRIIVDPINYEVKGDLETKIEGIPKKAREHREKGKVNLFSKIIVTIKMKNIPVYVPSLLKRCGIVTDTASCHCRAVTLVENLSSNRNDCAEITLDLIKKHIAEWKPLLCVCLIEPTKT